jgi:integrase/recombinase XerD
VSVAVDYDPLRDKNYQSTGLGEPIVNYLARKTNQGRRPRTLDDKERYLASLAQTFPSKRLEDITWADIDHWIALQPERSRRHRASHVRDFFRWATRFELIDKNPMDKLDPIARPSQKVYDIFNDAEVKALCDLPSVDGVLMQILFDAGLRKSEAIALQLARFRFVSTLTAPNGEIVILGGKGAKDRVVPMTATLEQRVAEFQLTEGLQTSDYLWYRVRSSGRVWRHTYRDKPVQETTFVRWWQRCIEDSGVRARNPHMTRHTFATRWLRRGGRLETLSMVMGHSSIKTTFDMYGHLDNRDVARDLALVEQSVLAQQ